MALGYGKKKRDLDSLEERQAINRWLKKKKKGREGEKEVAETERKIKQGRQTAKPRRNSATKDLLPSNHSEYLRNLQTRNQFPSRGPGHSWKII